MRVWVGVAFGRLWRFGIGIVIGVGVGVGFGGMRWDGIEGMR